MVLAMSLFPAIPFHDALHGPGCGSPFHHIRERHFSAMGFDDIPAARISRAPPRP
jgi:hypothetical protein